MKRFWMVLLVGLASAFPVAFAQDSEPFLGGGLSINFIQGNSLVALSFQGGAGNVIGSATLRGNADIGISPGNFFNLGADVLVPFSGDEISPYLGGGAGVLISGGSIFNIHGTGGLEFNIADQSALFAEIQPTLFISGGTVFGAVLRLGYNYHFD